MVYVYVYWDLGFVGGTEVVCGSKMRELRFGVCAVSMGTLNECPSSQFRLPLGAHYHRVWCPQWAVSSGALYRQYMVAPYAGNLR